MGTQRLVRRLDPTGSVHERIELDERDVEATSQLSTEGRLSVTAGAGDDRDLPHGLGARMEAPGARNSPAPTVFPRTENCFGRRVEMNRRVRVFALTAAVTFASAA